MSSGTGKKTRSSKRKAEDSASNEPKRQKKEKEKEKVKETISKNKKQDDKPVQPKKSKKNTANGSVELEKKKGLGDYTVDELLKLDGLHKWQYVCRYGLK